MVKKKRASKRISLKVQHKVKTKVRLVRRARVWRLAPARVSARAARPG
jgi:hypothetical protein